MRYLMAGGREMLDRASQIKGQKAVAKEETWRA